jgi:truncated hemoglobin YjbI
LFYKGIEMEKIDYEKLNDRIVEQAYENVLSKEQFQKLIQDKFDRAKSYQESLRRSPTFSIN